MRALVGAVAVGSLVLAGCGGTSDAVPSASGFGIASLASAQAATGLTECAAITDRAAQVDCALPYAAELLADVYAPIVESRGLEFTAPRLAYESTETECGTLSNVAYCPQDATIVLPRQRLISIGDRSATEVEWGPQSMSYFTQELTPEQLSAGGSFGAVTALAHEYAHHVQALIGYERLNAEAMKAEPDKVPEISSEFELMADCFAGWASAVLDQQGAVQIEPIDQWAAVTALAEVGDDFIQEGRGSDPEPPRTFEHGAANERANAWVEGAGYGFDGSEPYEGCLALSKQLISSRTQ